MNLFENLVELINEKPIDSIVTRKELIENLVWRNCFSLFYGGKPYVDSFDVYRRYLSKANYLGDTEKPGFYKILKKIEVDLSLNQLKKKAYPKKSYNKPHTNFGSIVQIGCGYCSKELTCEIRDPKINKAKLGCKEYEHHSEKR